MYLGINQLNSHANSIKSFQKYYNPYKADFCQVIQLEKIKIEQKRLTLSNFNSKIKKGPSQFLNDFCQRIHLSV